VHLHGGKTPPESDGWPEDLVVPGQSRIYRYPNAQDAALLWYHDHCHGHNRLNIYAGLFGLHSFATMSKTRCNCHAVSTKCAVIFEPGHRYGRQLSYPAAADPEHPWVPEYFGEIQLVNGKIFSVSRGAAAQIPPADSECRKRRFIVWPRTCVAPASDRRDQGLLGAAG